MKQDVIRTGPHETDWSVQGVGKDDDLQHLSTQELLVRKVKMSRGAADEYVREIGSNASLALRLLLQNSSDPVKHFRDFEASRDAVLQ